MYEISHAAGSLSFGLSSTLHSCAFPFHTHVLDRGGAVGNNSTNAMSVLSTQLLLFWRVRYRAVFAQCADDQIDSANVDAPADSA
eukprot:IDg17735t1